MNYYLKRRLNKISTWITLLLHLLFFGLFYFSLRDLAKWTPGVFNDANGLLRHVFWWLVVGSLFILTTFFSPISYFWWGWIDDVSSETEKDGTDLFFLSTAVPTNRKKIFWSKVTFLTSSLTVMYTLFFSLPLFLFLQKLNYLANFTSSQKGLFLAWIFLIFPLFFIAPLVVLLFSLASLESIWYTILKWFGRLSFIILILILFIVGRIIAYQEDFTLIDKIQDAFFWLDQNYLLVFVLTIGGLILLASLTCYLAYEKFQKKDLN